MADKIKRFAALATVILIVLLILSVLVVAIIDFPNKLPVLVSLTAAMVILPIFAWIFLWILGAVTRKKNIASFRSAEMEETMEKAAQIKEQLNQKK